MKKSLAALISLIILAVPFAGAMALTITLPENPGTGFTWTYEQSDDALLTEKENVYTPDAGAQDLVGAGGSRTWEFRPDGRGDAVLSFALARSGDAKPSVRLDLLYRVAAGAATLRGKVEMMLGNVIITLPENPTTGYTWQTDGGLGDVLMLKEDSYVPDANPGGLLGGGGTHRWHYVAKAPGDTAITFTYARPWESDAAETVEFSFSVEEDYNIAPIKP